ncbi:MAG TPA: NAD(P)-dependent oxidoreductase [Thermoplasmata archaeon]|nr:NAD(P)-dependent oxidoreductase [Thermoplasmata archaeon]
MTQEDARLVVAVPPSEGLRAHCARLLPQIATDFVGPDARGPWTEAEAVLIGTPARDLPHWTANSTPKLRFVQRLFTGLDGFPMDRFPESVEIAGNGGAYAPFVAEHALALALGVSHRLREGHARVAEGRLRPPLSNRYLDGKVALVLGLGEIGRATARRLAGLGMHVEAVTRAGNPDPEVRRSYPAAALREAVSGAMVVVDCRPLTRSTLGTIDRAVLEAMRPDAILVNVGRARTVNEADLRAHLASHPEFEAAFDVFWHEAFETGALPEGPGLAGLPNFLGTPHMAGIGPEARDRAERMAVENLLRFFSGEKPRYIADRDEYRFG